MVIRDKGDKDDTMDNVLAHQAQVGRNDFRLDWTNYKHQTKGEILDKPWVIIDKSYNSYELQDKWKNLGLTHLQTLTQLVTHCYSLVLRIVVLVMSLVRINTIQKEKGMVSSLFLWFI